MIEFKITGWSSRARKSETSDQITRNLFLISNGIWYINLLFSLIPQFDAMTLTGGYKSYHGKKSTLHLEWAAAEDDGRNYKNAFFSGYIVKVSLLILLALHVMGQWGCKNQQTHTQRVYGRAKDEMNIFLLPLFKEWRKAYALAFILRWKSELWNVPS